MKNKNANTLMLLTGIVAGSALTLFIKSDKGQQLLDIALSKGEALKSAASDNAHLLMEEGRQAIDQVIESSKSTLVSATEDVKDIAESKIETFQKGVEKAKKQIAKA